MAGGDRGALRSNLSIRRFTSTLPSYFFIYLSNLYISASFVYTLRIFYPDEPSAPAGRALFNSVSQQMPSAPHYGKSVNDGGLVDQPSAAQIAAAQAQSKVAQQKPIPHYGKALNDGGV